MKNPVRFDPTARGPLDGIRVIDLSRLVEVRRDVGSGVGPVDGHVGLVHRDVRCRGRSEEDVVQIGHEIARFVPGEEGHGLAAVRQP